MNILMVLTSHDQLGDTGKKTGFWLEEFAAPCYVLTDAERRSRWLLLRAASRRSTPKAIFPRTKPS